MSRIESTLHMSDISEYSVVVAIDQFDFSFQIKTKWVWVCLCVGAQLIQI